MSRPINLELTQPPHLIINGLGILMLLASLLLLGFIWQHYQAQQASAATIQQAFNQQILPKSATVQSVSESIPAAELKQISTIVESLVTPWQPLLLAIEQADMPDIALLSIDPSIKKQQVTLVGEAKNLQTVLRYIEQLEAQDVLQEVYLQKHMVEETDVSKPVTFNAVAKWKVSQ
jgi:hypothetical protein